MRRMNLAVAAAFFFCAVVQARAKETVLPDSCGEDKVKFDAKLEKDHIAPADPTSGKAQIIFITSKTPTPAFTPGTNPTARFGMDGAWVGAAKGDSYFTLDVAPGEHHLCATLQSSAMRLKGVGMKTFTATAGKIYYFELRLTLVKLAYGLDDGLDFRALDEDEGKYRIKASSPSRFKIK